MPGNFHGTSNISVRQKYWGMAPASYGRKSCVSYAMVTEYSSLMGGPDLPHWKVEGLAFVYSILL